MATKIIRLAGTWFALLLAVVVSTSTVWAQPKSKKTGTFHVTGSYPTKIFKAGKRRFGYHLVATGNSYTLELVGATFFRVLSKTPDKPKRIEISLNLDRNKQSSLVINLTNKSKPFFFWVPKGLHLVTITPNFDVWLRVTKAKRILEKKSRKARWHVIEKAVPITQNIIPKSSSNDKEFALPPIPEDNVTKMNASRSASIKPLSPIPDKTKRKTKKSTATGSNTFELSHQIATPKPGSNENFKLATHHQEAVSSAYELTEELPKPNNWMVSVGLKVGGVLPRTELDFTAGYSLETEITSDYFIKRLGIYCDVGYTLMKHQEQKIFPGRGQSQLIQNSHTIPIELGLVYRYDAPGWFAWPYAKIGFAMDVTRTSFQYFSVPNVSENDLSLGFGLTAGTMLPLAMGGLLLEIRYREIWAQMHEMGSTGEDMFSAVSFWLGYQLDFSI